MRGVVPAGRERVRVTVEGDAAADEHEPVDVCSTAPKSCEQKRIVTPRSLSSSLEERGERLLGVDVDAGRRLVEDEQGRDAPRGPWPETHAAAARPRAGSGPSGLVMRGRALDRLVDERAIATPEEPSRPTSPLSTTSRTVAGASMPS